MAINDAAARQLTAVARRLSNHGGNRTPCEVSADSAQPLDELDDEIVEIEDYDSESAIDDADDEPSTPPKTSGSVPRRMTLFGLAVVAALAVLVGWVGFHVYQSHEAQVQRSQFLQVARQGALNLTTIDWQHADADVHRILEGAIGEFRDDFTTRAQPFIDVVKQVKAKTVGTISEAGLESQTADSAQALVTVSVQTSNAGVSDQVPRAWRMRIDVQKVGDQVKVSSVRFVP